MFWDRWQYRAPLASRQIIAYWERPTIPIVREFRVAHLVRVSVQCRQLIKHPIDRPHPIREPSRDGRRRLQGSMNPAQVVVQEPDIQVAFILDLCLYCTDNSNTVNRENRLDCDFYVGTMMVWARNDQDRRGSPPIGLRAAISRFALNEQRRLPSIKRHSWRGSLCRGGYEND